MCTQETGTSFAGKRVFVMDHAYWGSEFGVEEIAQIITGNRPELAAAGCTVEEIPDETALCERAAAAIADGEVIGWFQGGVGTAWGNRSIACDPRRADMRALLNAKIKRRELPSIARGVRTRMVRGGRRRPVYDAGPRFAKRSESSSPQ